MVRWNYISLTFKSLFYNEFASLLYLVETLLAPMFWIVDRFSNVLGRILVIGEIILTSSVLIILYVIGLPYYWQKSPLLTVCLMILGHWILLNIVFNFFMGLRTEPGAPPEGILVSEVVSVCKKCIAPKPPRTHHCSVCNRCVLKMDHHCPLLNNCVGHYNHRYFFLYMVYMACGTLFVLVCGFEIFFNEIWLGGEGGRGWRDALYDFWNPKEDSEADLHVGFPVKNNETHLIDLFEGSPGIPVRIEFEDEQPSGMNLFRSSIMFVSTVSLGCFVALFTLSVWHWRLITKGETSIEAHINKKESERLKRMKKIYRSPYNFGSRENLKTFFGIIRTRDIFYVFVPSLYTPSGDGLSWPNSVLKLDSTRHDKAA